MTSPGDVVSQSTTRGSCDQALYSWGCGEFGQHGHGVKDDVTLADGQLEAFEGKSIKLIACGASHSVAVTEDNQVYVWGNSSSGQLGCGDCESRWKPTKIQLYAHQPKPPEVAGVACGSRHTFVWLKNGHMFSFGNNYFGQLGYDFRIKNYKDNQVRPHLLRTLIHRPVLQVACGEKHSLMLFKDRRVAALGNNGFGQLGTGNREEVVVPKVLDDLPDIRSVTCGASHSLAVAENGKAYMWGQGKACGQRHGDILLPELARMPRDNVVSAAAGQLYSLLLTATGNVYSFGMGTNGQLGHGAVKFLSTPRRISSEHIRNKVTSIDCGDTYSVAVTEDGALYMWGRCIHVLEEGESVHFKVDQPQRVMGQAGPIKVVSCGAWHCTALSGTPDVQKWEEFLDIESDDDKDEMMQNGDLESDSASTSAAESEVDIPLDWAPLREKTTITLAEFYAPSPDIPSLDGIVPSPDIMEPIAEHSPKSQEKKQPLSFNRTFQSSESQDDEFTSQNGHSPVTVPVPKETVQEESIPVTIFTKENGELKTYSNTEEEPILSGSKCDSPVKALRANEKPVRPSQADKVNLFQMTTAMPDPGLVTKTQLKLREQATVASKNLDFVPVGNLASGNYRYGTAGVTIQTHKGYSRVLPEKARVTPAAVRRLMKTSSKGKLVRQVKNESTSYQELPRDYAPNGTERVLGLPRTVTMMASDSISCNIAGSRNVSVPRKPHFIRENTLKLDVDVRRPSTQPVFSSAGSWRNDREMAVAVTAKSSSPPKDLSGLLSASVAPSARTRGRTTRGNQTQGGHNSKPKR